MSEHWPTSRRPRTTVGPASPIPLLPRGGAKSRFGFAESNENLVPYGLLQHVHMPEMGAQPGDRDGRGRQPRSEAELDVFKDFIARNPLAGSPIQGTGGVRKVRWAASGRGKRGGARVIYYFRDEGMPLFRLTAYAKNVADDLTAQQKRGIAAAVANLVEHYGRK